MQRIVALDFGLKRTGIALTDELNIIASGLTTVDSRELMTFLQRLIPEKNIGTIVLGEPKRLNLEDSHSSSNVRHLKDWSGEYYKPRICILSANNNFCG